MLLSNQGLEFIKTVEGFRPDAYQDSVGIWTIGYGHTGHDVVPGLVISESRALELLAQDVQVAVRVVNEAVKVPLTQNPFDALVDFVFNIGAGAFKGSTLLRMLNAGDYAGAAGQFGRWDKAGKNKVKGLTRRREAERQMFIAS